MQDDPSSLAVEQFLFKPMSSYMWDTWAFYANGQFYLYYLTKSHPDRDGVGLAVSHDGVHWRDVGRVLAKGGDVAWLGSGAIWRRLGPYGEKLDYLMNFSEWRGDETTGRQTIFFAVSSDLVNWCRVSALEFEQDATWYRRTGRWDNVWAVERDGGGYWGYWAATPIENIVAIGFGQSDDGLNWKALEPAHLCEAKVGPPKLLSPEVSAVYRRGDKFYVLAGLDDLEPCVNEDFSDFRPGHTTFVADRPGGPFRPASRNRRLLVGNCSYFLRFVETPCGVLAHYHVWETRSGLPLKVIEESVCLAPMQRAVWDDDGTLRLRWWEANDGAKTRPIEIGDSLGAAALKVDEALLLEGTLHFTPEPVGLFLEGDHDWGTAILVQDGGRVEYGDARADGSGFVKQGFVDRELQLGGTVRFRLIRKGRITEFYLNDYLMQSYCLPALGTGRIAVLGPADSIVDLEAWYASPLHGLR